MPELPRILLYHYTSSPIAQRVVQYLSLTKTPFTSVRVSPTIPRPELLSLGITYRQVPVLVIGRNVYCDSSLIIDVLEDLSSGKLNQNDGVEKIIESWVMSRVFTVVPRLIPPDAKFLQDASFVKDREEWTNRSWKPQDLAKARQRNLESIGYVLNLLEHELLPRSKWLGGDKIAISDIHVAFALRWAVQLGMFGETYSKQTHPRVWEWIAAYSTAVKESSEVGRLTGDAAKDVIFASPLPSKPSFTPDTSQLEDGAFVEVFPHGWNHTVNPQRGTLIGLDWKQATLLVGEGDRKTHVHFPRERYSIRKVNTSRL